MEKEPVPPSPSKTVKRGTQYKRARKRQKRRSQRQYHGRKERLLERNKALIEDLQLTKERQLRVAAENALLKRRAIAKLTSTLIPGTRPSVPASDHRAFDSHEFQSVRQIPSSALKVHGHSVGKGAFGKCFRASLVSHTSVCVKLFRQAKKYASVFPLEVILTSRLCHPNLPWLYGRAATEDNQNMLVMSFHSIAGIPCSLYDATHGKIQDVNLSQGDWKVILLGLASAVQYIHHNTILHNDIKSDNIVLDGQPSKIRSVLIDFGKGCLVSQAKGYKLSKASRDYHKQHHPQVAPDLVDGHCKQSTHSDVYSVGRVIQQINTTFLKMPALFSYGSLCTEYLCTNRPSTDDLCIFLHNLLSS